ncbi:MAG: zf-HC2 domain-containing protein [Planctomycetes bacterium]|nr:zf-HC2 domain-containing protein [Planctomycetota bacterium]
MKECNKIKELLPLYVSRDITAYEVETVENHLALCGECKREAEKYQSIKSELGGLKEVSRPPEFWIGYERSLYDKIETIGSAKPAWQFALLRTAAVLLIGILTGYFVAPFIGLKSPQETVEEPGIGIVKAEDPSVKIIANETLGLKLYPVSEALGAHLNINPNCGMVVSDFIGECPAQGCGLMKGDIITGINGEPLSGNLVLPSGSRINLHIIRQGKVINIAVDLLEKRR